MRPLPIRLASWPLLLVLLHSVTARSQELVPITEELAPGAELIEELPGYEPQDAAAAVVTEQNVLAQDAFWPFQVALARDWQPPGQAEPLKAGRTGILVCVEASGLVRLDFGRFGRHRVPLDATDLVARANEVRRGELRKVGPNLVRILGTQLVDSAQGVPLGYEVVARSRGFLSVFADPDAADFPELAAALAALPARDGVMTVFFPQGEQPTHEVVARLRSLAWVVPFAFDHSSESLARALLAEPTALPALLLQTPEGRVLFESPWPDAGSDTLVKLAAALNEAFGTPLAAQEAGRR